VETPHEIIADLAAKYSQPCSAVRSELLRRALGTEMANGYTSLDQARKLARLVRLAPDDTLLDLGAGRGWPGVQMAIESGCRLISTDVTVEGASAAKRWLRQVDPRSRPCIVAADGLGLPFQPAVFNAVVHADVLC
jgi:cyclopropane fatty-acyl-phospholipid synthase-like methyltransferase